MTGGRKHPGIKGSKRITGQERLSWDGRRKGSREETLGGIINTKELSKKSHIEIYCSRSFLNYIYTQT